MARNKKLSKASLTIILVIMIGIIIIVAYYVRVGSRSDIQYGDIQDINITVDDETIDEDESIGETLTCTVMDCGDALSVLIDIGQTEILYDCGYESDGEKIAKKIAQKVDGKLDYLIVSHSHADHAGGVPALAKAYDIECCITSGETSGSSVQFEKAMQALREEGCEMIEDQDMVFDLGYGARLSIYEVFDPKEEDDPNNLSVVAAVNYKEKAIVLTGDSEKKVEKRLKGKFKEVDLFIAGHHMSNTSNSQAFLEELTPAFIIGSCEGKGSEHGFPHKEVIARCKVVTEEVYTTADNGDITYKTNGAESTVDAEKVAGADE